eukprot:CAMPEP_0170193646 /NCGR_PEP_ID=MMETSP0040_2-20121228/57352_1 /TAXON_ID=641309 /ORGANISM="Lotharella oceanica, Strain CCMP622" /LENGTH=193 /DNA_ID=CAMNT_0010442337 /DNA_START=66 /DNA_END=647 /DNA_ORIENTATION=-
MSRRQRPKTGAGNMSPARIDSEKTNSGVKVPYKVKRETSTLYHSALVMHYLALVRAAGKPTHKLRTPISRRLENMAGEHDFVGDMVKGNEELAEKTEELRQGYHEAQKAHEYESGERPEYKERKLFVEQQRKKALAESRRYATALLQHYQEKRFKDMKQPHLPGRGRANISRLGGGKGSNVVLKSTAKRIVRT